MHVNVIVEVYFYNFIFLRLFIYPGAMQLLLHFAECSIILLYDAKVFLDVKPSTTIFLESNQMKLHDVNICFII